MRSARNGFCSGTAFLRRCVLCVFLLVAVTTTASAQTRTPYLCAVRAVRALASDYPAFVRLVHPLKGLVYTESGVTLADGRVFPAKALLARTPVPIERHYGDDDSSRPVVVRDYLKAVVRRHAFQRTKDIRRNITGLAHSTDVFHAAGPGETLISFHVTDPAQELAWACLVVRTQVYRGAAFVTGLDYLYWTP